MAIIMLLKNIQIHYPNEKILVKNLTDICHDLLENIIIIINDYIKVIKLKTIFKSNKRKPCFILW